MLFITTIALVIHDGVSYPAVTWANQPRNEQLAASYKPLTSDDRSHANRLLK